MSGLKARPNQGELARREREGQGTLAPKDGDEEELLRHYRTSHSPQELYQKLIEQEGVLELASGPVLDARARAVPTRYVVEPQRDGFRVYCGEVGRESSTTGILANLQLCADFVEVGRDTQVNLRFVYRRSGWALQRVLGLGLTGLGGLLWVFLAAGGAFWDRALLYVAFLLFVSPVIVRDLRAKARRRQEKLALLNLVEGAFGQLALPEAESSPSPYRSR